MKFGCKDLKRWFNVTFWTNVRKLYYKCENKEIFKEYLMVFYKSNKK